VVVGSRERCRRVRGGRVRSRLTQNWRRRML
jgi:hypothetical protein